MCVISGIAVRNVRSLLLSSLRGLLEKRCAYVLQICFFEGILLTIAHIEMSVDLDVADKVSTDIAKHSPLCGSCLYIACSDIITASTSCLLNTHMAEALKNNGSSDACLHLVLWALR